MAGDMEKGTFQRYSLFSKFILPLIQFLHCPVLVSVTAEKLLSADVKRKSLPVQTERQTMR